MRALWTTERTPPPGPSDPGFARATVAAAVVVVVAGTLGMLWLRGWGRVGFEVPSVPWYFSFPFYVFPGPRLDPGWAAAAVPVVAASVAATVALYRARTEAWPRRVAASAGLAAVLALAVAALAGGPAAWGAPFDYAGEYPAGASRVVVALAGGLWQAAGYDVPAAVLAVHGAYQAAPGRRAGRWPTGCPATCSPSAASWCPWCWSRWSVSCWPGGSGSRWWSGCLPARHCWSRWCSIPRW